MITNPAGSGLLVASVISRPGVEGEFFCGLGSVGVSCTNGSGVLQAYSRDSHSAPVGVKVGTHGFKIFGHLCVFRFFVAEVDFHAPDIDAQEEDG